MAMGAMEDGTPTTTTVIIITTDTTTNIVIGNDRIMAEIGIDTTRMASYLIRCGLVVPRLCSLQSTINLRAFWSLLIRSRRPRKRP